MCVCLCVCVCVCICVCVCVSMRMRFRVRVYVRRVYVRARVCFTCKKEVSAFNCWFYSTIFHNIIWCTTREKGPYTICVQRRHTSACSFAQADLGRRCPLTESADTVANVDEQRISRSDSTRMRMLIWTFTVRIWLKGPFPTFDTNYANKSHLNKDYLLIRAQLFKANDVVS